MKGTLTASQSLKLLVSVNDYKKGGHGRDLRKSLVSASTETSFEIFQDKSRKPESTFSATVEELLLCNVALFDSTPLKEQIDANILIQFGISYALRKQSLFLRIRNNSSAVPMIKTPIITDYQLTFDDYSDISYFLDSRVKQWLSLLTIPSEHIYTQMLTHTFVVFGVDVFKQADIYQAIKNFAGGTDWKFEFYTDLGTLSKLDDLATSIKKNDFCVFCLGYDNDERINLGIGLAIGMGVPFLILLRGPNELPESLQGYDGLIRYQEPSDLENQLKLYARTFLSDEVKQWEGATYFYILSRLEKQIASATRLKELERVEKILHAITKSFRSNPAKPYALLGDLYREINHKFSPHDIEPLRVALKYYQEALQIDNHFQHCLDAISAVERHIALIELLEKGQYHSIPGLIRIIGEDLQSEQFNHSRDFLVTTVRELITKKDYIHALLLLAAIQTHDRSEAVQELVKEVIHKLSATDYLGALQNAQAHIILLEDNIKSMQKNNNEIRERLSKGQEMLDTANLEVARITSQRDKILEQISVLATSNEQTTRLKMRIQATREEYTDKRILVNFGIGWAAYIALIGNPYVVRQMQWLTATEGFLLQSGDVIYHDEGKRHWYVP